MTRIRIAVLFVFCIVAPGLFALGPCSYFILTVVGFDIGGSDSNHVSGDARVECYTYNMQRWYGEFSARSWIVDETAGGVTVAEATGGPFTHTHVWIGATTASAPREECFRLRVSGESTDTSQEIGSAQLCAPSECEVNPWRIGCGDPPPDCPLLVNLGNGPWRLTGRDDPVLFDIDGDGLRDAITWTAAEEPLAFVALDDNRNGVIDGGQELFGTARRMQNGLLAPNGFAALASHDVNGDGVIDRTDPIFAALLLWTDRNHNGLSEPGELQPIGETGISALSTTFKMVGRSDAEGNEFRLKGSSRTRHGDRPYYDVFFIRIP